jgi:hypothetical protein
MVEAATASFVALHIRRKWSDIVQLKASLAGALLKYRCGSSRFRWMKTSVECVSIADWALDRVCSGPQYGPQIDKGLEQKKTKKQGGNRNCLRLWEQAGTGPEQWLGSMKVTDEKKRLGRRINRARAGG